MSLPLLLLGCALFKPPAPAVPTPTETPVAEAEAPVSFAPLEERVNVLIAEAIETDRKDRLVAARELMVQMRNKEPAAQHKVYDYLDEVLKIEERARPAPIAIDAPIVPIEEEPLDTPPARTPSKPSPSPSPSSPSPSSPSPSSPSPSPSSPSSASVTPPEPVAATITNPADQAALAAARKAVADARYLDAVSLLSTSSSPESAAVRKEAVDAWARAERERAGHAFLDARALPPGNEKILALQEVRKALAAINDRFPDNAYAAQIKDNLVKVDADLAALGAKP